MAMFTQSNIDNNQTIFCVNNSNYVSNKFPHYPKHVFTHADR